MDANAYARQLKQLLPGGSLWRLDAGSWLSKLLLGVADELARVDDRGDDLVNEWDPRTALETLPDWERMLGITPAASATAIEREAVVAATLAARGGATASYFIGLAAHLGFVATIDYPAAHTWRMNVDLTLSVSTAVLDWQARAGAARAGDRVASRSVAVLEGLINRLKPAHTVALFLYTS